MMSVSVKRFSLGLTALFAAVSAAPAQAVDRVTSASAEFPTETAAVVAATSAFFDAAERAASGERAPQQQPVIGLPEVVSPARLGDQDDPRFEVLTREGPVQHLTGYRISWYPVDRFLGAVDFMGTWNNNRNLVCGYVTWDLSTSGTPQLDDVTANFVDLAELASFSPAEVHEALLEANCAYGAIDVNFAFFAPVN